MAHVNLTLPVFNEEKQMAKSIALLHRFLKEQCRFRCEIVIANNGSTDRTGEVAEMLCEQYANVQLVNIKHRGRGQAIKQVWLQSQAEVLSYMDVDLSTDLSAFPALIDAVTLRGFDLAAGSRLLPESQTERCLKRELISKSYNWLIKAFFHTRFSDAQCGFKAITRKAADALLPLVEDTGWFFDTELLVVAEKLGCRIFDLPVRWVEDRDSRVKIMSTAVADIKGLIRLRRRLRPSKKGTGRNGGILPAGLH